MKKKPKPRTVWLIENKASPKKLLYTVVCMRKRDAEQAVKAFSRCGRIRKFVEVCDE